MRMQQHAPRSGLSKLCLCLCLGLALFACDGDDDASDTGDAGAPCDPIINSMQNCYCMTGTMGLRYCRAPSNTWGECRCNEPLPPTPCTPGALVSCTCPDGTPSQQYCRASNTRDPCMCDGHSALDSGHLDSGERPFDASFDSGPDGAFDANQSTDPDVDAS